MYDILCMHFTLYRTLAHVQFVDYEKAAQAIADLDGMCFYRRNLVVGFQQTRISQEDIISKRLKKLIIKVKFDNNQGKQYACFYSVQSIPWAGLTKSG